MRSKLSQSVARIGEAPLGNPRTPDPARWHRNAHARPIDYVLGPRLIAIGLPLLVALVGCPASHQESDDPMRSGTADPQSSDTNGSAHVGFRWPSNSSSILMKLDIATTDSEGTIEIELMPGLAPESVARVVRLAREGRYDGTTFHRVIRGFMIQGGDPNSRDQDPTNDGQGGALSDLPDEFSSAPFERGIVALANRGRRNSGSSQFFILQADHRDLDGRYTALGRVTRGIEFVDAIANTPTDKVGRWGPKDRPIENVSIRRAQIVTQELPAQSELPDSSPPSGPLRLSQHPTPDSSLQ